MEKARIHRMYDWVNRHAAIVTVVLIVGIIGIGTAGVMTADTSEPSFDPEAEIFTIYERAEEVLQSESTLAQASYLVEAAGGGDVLTANALREWHAASSRVRASATNREHLVDRFDTESGTAVPGVLSIADLVDSTIPGGLAGATDADVKAALDAVLADGSPFAEMRYTLSEQATSFEGPSGTVWAGPAFTAQVVYDSATFVDNPAAEMWLRDVQAMFQEDATHTRSLGIAIDGELAFSEGATNSAPFIFLAVALIIVLIAIVHRSYWSAVVVAAGLTATTIAYYGTSALLGLKMGSMLLAFVVPIAAISFGVDFFIHGIGRVREAQIDGGLSAERAYPAGMAAVFTALLLAASSSIAAFLSNVSSGTEAIVQFGIGAAIALGWSYVILGQLAPRVLIGIERFVGANPVKGATRYLYVAAMAVVAVVGGLAVALAAVMTAVGIGALVVVLLALVVGPALLTRWRNTRAARKGAAIQVRNHGAAHGLPAAGTLVHFLARWRQVTVPVALVVFALALMAALQVKSGFEITDFLSSNSDFATSIDRVDEHFPSSGQGSSFVLVDGDLTSPDALAALDGAVGVLDASSADFGRNGGGELVVQLHAGDLVRMTLASPEAAEVIADGGANLADANGDGYPDSSAAIRAVYDFISESGVPAPDGGVALTPDEIAGVLSDDGGAVQTTAVTVMVGSFTDGLVIEPAEDALNAAALSIEQAVPGLDASVSGEVLTSYHGLAAFTQSMVVSLPLAILLTLILASLLLRSFRYALISVIPIAFVVTGVYAFMAVGGYTVNVVTATIAAIAVGVGIDFSTHFTARYREELERQSNRLEAVRSAGEGTGGALVLSALTSVLGFMVMAFAPNPVFATFGLLTSVMIGLALISALVVLPSLLVMATPRRTGPPRADDRMPEVVEDGKQRVLVGV
jgi:predicted RND superfamily exporter protein